jgi:hypothetical protein
MNLRNNGPVNDNVSADVSAVNIIVFFPRLSIALILKFPPFPGVVVRGRASKHSYQVSPPGLLTLRRCRIARIDKPC